MPSIDVLANTRAAQRDVKDLSTAFDGVADSLDDVTRDADRAGDKMERTFRDIIQDARKAERAVEDIGDGTKRGMGKAGEATGEFKAEALSNLSEVTSSFTGDITSIGDLVQGTFGGLAGSLPGVLGAAGAAAAVGVGLITAAFAAAEEERKKFQERAADLAGAYIEAGQSVLDVVTLASRVSGVLTNEEQRREAEALAKVLGVDLPEAARIMAGDANALEAAYGVLSGRQESLNKAMKDGGSIGEEQMIAYGGAQGAINAATQELDKWRGVQDGARDGADAYTRALNDMVAAAGEVGVEVDEVGNKLLTLPNNVQVMVSAQTGQATTNVSRFGGDVDGVIDRLNAREVLIRTRFDNSDFDRKMAAMQERAARGITLQMNPRMGATWQ